MRRSFFTLTELVAVIAVVVVATSFAVSSFRGESPARKVENASLEFEAYCARVRYHALEAGADRVVSFEPSGSRFLMTDPAAEEEEEPKKQFVWKLPEGFELGEEALRAETDERGFLEVFRFYADGSANASFEFILRYKTFQRRFAVSPITGLLNWKEESSR